MEPDLADLPTHPLRLADLATARPTSFDLTPTEAERATIAKALDLNALRKLRFAGQLTPRGRTDWDLRADLGATVVQDCVITLAPVTTRIDETVTRQYCADLPDVTATEIEMPQDDTIEPLPTMLDLAAVMIEALSLALPAFPKAPGAELDQVNYAEPGITAMTDAEAKPFAALQSLKESLENKGDGSK